MWWVCAFAGMRMGMGRAATKPVAMARVAAKMVENCILIVVVGGLVAEQKLQMEGLKLWKEGMR